MESVEEKRIHRSKERQRKVSVIAEAQKRIDNSIERYVEVLSNCQWQAAQYYAIAGKEIKGTWVFDETS